MNLTRNNGLSERHWPWLPAGLETFFDLGFVRARHPALSDLADEGLLLRLTDPGNENPEDPNPLLDLAFFVAQAGPARLAGRNPILAFLTDRALFGYWPNRLFCPAWFSHGRRLPTLSPGRILATALDSLGAGKLTGFHPMIDVDHLARTMGRPVTPAFLTELFAPDFPAVAPHLLVDPAFMAEARGTPFATLREVLAHYHDAARDLSTHPLFCVEHYRQGLGISDPAFRSVWHYLGAADPASPHPLVDHDHYRRELREAGHPAPRRPLEHYLQTGGAAGISPSPWFCEGHYRRQTGGTGGVGGTPTETGARTGLVDYLSGGFRHYNPHPLASMAYFRSVLPGPWTATRNPAMRMARGIDMLPAEAFPLLRPADTADPADAPVRTGLYGETAGAGLLSHGYASRLVADRAPGLSVIRTYLERGLHHRPRVLLAFERLKDTPAVAAWLNLLIACRDDDRIEFIVAARGGGPLAPPFPPRAPVRPLAGPPPPPRWRPSRARLRRAGASVAPSRHPGHPALLHRPRPTRTRPARPRGPAPRPWPAARNPACRRGRADRVRQRDGGIRPPCRAPDRRGALPRGRAVPVVRRGSEMGQHGAFLRHPPPARGRRRRSAERARARTAGPRAAGRGCVRPPVARGTALPGGPRRGRGGRRHDLGRGGLAGRDPGPRLRRDLRHAGRYRRPGECPVRQPRRCRRPPRRGTERNGGTGGAPWPLRIWRLAGDPAELGELVRLGHLFDRIELRAAGAIAALEARDPRIARRARPWQEGSPCAAPT